MLATRCLTAQLDGIPRTNRAVKAKKNIKGTLESTDEAPESSQHSFMQLGAVMRIAAKDDMGQRRRRRQRFHRCGDRDAGGAVSWKAEGAS